MSPWDVPETQILGLQVHQLSSTQQTSVKDGQMHSSCFGMWLVSMFVL